MTGAEFHFDAMVRIESSSSKFPLETLARVAVGLWGGHLSAEGWIDVLLVQEPGLNAAAFAFIGEGDYARVVGRARCLPARPWLPMPTVLIVNPRTFEIHRRAQSA